MGKGKGGKQLCACPLYYGAEQQLVQEMPTEEMGGTPGVEGEERAALEDSKRDLDISL